MGIRESLDKAEALSRDILAAATRDDWDTAIQREMERSPLIAALKNQPLSVTMTRQELLSALERIDDINRQTAHLARQRHAEIGTLLSVFDKRP